MTVDDVRFLLGTWHGSGTLKDQPFETRMEVRDLLGRSVEVDYESARNGQVVHRERIVYHMDAVAGLAALTIAANGPVGQRWLVTRTDDGRKLELTRDPRDGVQETVHLWTIERVDDATLHSDWFQPGRCMARTVGLS